MFNRTIETRIVKKAKTDNGPGVQYQTPEKIFDYGLAVEGVARTVIQEAAKCVVAYMAIDTIRKIAINRLSK